MNKKSLAHVFSLHCDEHSKEAISGRTASSPVSTTAAIEIIKYFSYIELMKLLFNQKYFKKYNQLNMSKNIEITNDYKDFKILITEKIRKSKIKAGI